MAPHGLPPHGGTAPHGLPPSQGETKGGRIPSFLFAPRRPRCSTTPNPLLVKEKGSAARWPVLVACAASVIVELLFAAGSTLWVATDSGWYIRLGAEVAQSGDFSNDLFQFRPPGYPAFLGLLFYGFGNSAGAAIVLLQHAMVVGVVFFATRTAATLWPQPLFVLTAGLLCALSPHLSGYANTVLTEVPYAFLLAAAVYCLVRFQVHSSYAHLASASLLCGVAALVKGAGQIAVLVCLATALGFAWQSFKANRRVATFLYPLACCAGSAGAVVLPVMWNNYTRTGHFQISCALGVELYGRAVLTDKLAATDHPALRSLEETLVEAKRRGIVGPSTSLGDHHALLNAHRSVHNASVADAAAAMGHAAIQLLAENPATVARSTLRYGYWMLVLPDPVYRVVPEHMPPEMFDLESSDAAVARVAGGETVERYLPVRRQPTRWSAALSRVTSAYHRVVDRGPPILGTGDTLYEELIQLALLGILIAFARADRLRWFVPAAMLVGHIAVSAFLVGPAVRYKTPVHFLLWTFLALTLATLATLFRRTLCPVGTIRK